MKTYTEEIISEAVSDEPDNNISLEALQLRMRFVKAIAEQKTILRTASTVLLGPVLDLLGKDPHQWSSRPCSTCHAISSIVGKPFGCNAYKE